MARTWRWASAQVHPGPLLGSARACVGRKTEQPGDAARPSVEWMRGEGGHLARALGWERRRRLMELTSLATAAWRSNRRPHVARLRCRPSDLAKAERHTTGSTTPALRPHASHLHCRLFELAVSHQIRHRLVYV